MHSKKPLAGANSFFRESFPFEKKPWNPLVSGQNIMKSEKEDPNIGESGVEALLVYSSKDERICHKKVEIEW